MHGTVLSIMIISSKTEFLGPKGLKDLINIQSCLVLNCKKLFVL